MRKRLIFSFFFILTFLLNLLSQTNDPVIKDGKLVIDVDKAVSLALANNLNLKTERLKYQSSLWSMVTSWNQFLPSITMSATLSRSNLNEDDRTTVVPNFNTWPITTNEVVAPQWMIIANFQLSLTLNAAMGFQIYQTVLDYNNGKINLEIATNRIKRDTKKSLYNLILLEKNIEIMEKSLAAAEKRYNQAKTMFKNGLISEYDMLTAQVGYENIKPQLIEMKNQYKIYLLQFKQMIGIKRDAEIVLAADIKTPKVELNDKELQRKVITSNLDLKSMLNNINSLNNIKFMAISGLTPTFVLSYTMDPYFRKDALENQWFKDKDYNEENWKQKSGMFGLTISLPVSSFIPFSKEQMKVLTAQYQIEQAKIGYKNLKENIDMQLDTTLLSMKKSIESIKVLEFNITVAERAYQKAEEAYMAGTKDLLDVQNSEIELKKAELNLLKEELNYTTGLLDLEYILNSQLN